MNLQDFVAESMNQSVRQVFSTMLGVELGPGEAVEGSGAPEDPAEVLALIGLAGAWAGAGSISCSASAACRMCASMLMTEADAVNADVLDAVAELTNMIIGNVKTELESQTGPLGLSIPTVVYGRNFQTKTAGAPGWMTLRFRWDADIITVKLCLAPHDRDPRPTPLSMVEKAATMLEHAVPAG